MKSWYLRQVWSTTRDFDLQFESFNDKVPAGRNANVLDCDIVVSEFELPSSFYVHFWINTLGKDMNPIIPAKLLALLFFYKDGCSMKIFV